MLCDYYWILTFVVMPEPNSETNKELSQDELKEMSGGALINAGRPADAPQIKPRGKTSFSELSDISRNFKSKERVSE